MGNADKFFLDKIINLLGINDRLKLVIFHHNESAKASYIHKLINYYSYDKISELIDLDYLSFEKSPPIFKNKNEISQ